MTITFKDVAKLAGVSTQTVSRVTNGADNVAESTRKKVNDAIKQLGYVPNKGAQMLSRAKSKIIGIVSLDISLHGVALIINGIRSQSHDNGYATALSIVENNDFDNVREAIRELISQQVDSIILNVPLDGHAAEAIVEQYQHLHLVFIDVPEDAKVHYVCGAHSEGAKLAAQHLINLDRKQFVLVTGPSESTASQIRQHNWVNSIESSDAKINGQFEGDWQASSGYMAIRDFVAKQVPFDAVLVASDQMALGVLCALNELNIQVPDQVSVMGFDGIKDSAFFTPPLTTVEQNFIEIGKQAVSLSLESSDQPVINMQKTVPVQLLVRQSTAAKKEVTYQKKDILARLDEIRNLLPS
ncbi:lac repressor [Vibrio sp. MACH09]|uniref:LacI family DNA-binding transcriptional regulator n=1 Tax=Vibrio sp. MACH09 TaxID=3025122 RepID=UPI00278CACF7|nr:LacI family DNA-binding transcriptional regulator [Vibrio sp. MACH09]GLO61454.1 lac repressor [Vibrio sp. MACH09]